MKTDPIKEFLDNELNWIDTVNGQEIEIETEVKTGNSFKNTNKEETDTVTVTSNNVYKTVNSWEKVTDSVTPNKEDLDRINEEITYLRYQPAAVAQTLAEKLNDQNSYLYYLLLAKNNDHDKLIEALSYVADADHRGIIRTKKAIYFNSIIKRWGMKTKFKSR